MFRQMFRLDRMTRASTRVAAESPRDHPSHRGSHVESGGIRRFIYLRKENVQRKIRGKVDHLYGTTDVP